MKTEWDYTGMAKAYLSRPDYADEVLKAIVEIVKFKPGDKVCDIGAGVGHLSIPLARLGYIVDAVEPNDDMRNTGKSRTQNEAISWFEGIAENTGRPDNEYNLVSFGSSFGVCDREKALVETYRILKHKGWFICLWNHRNFDDPIQKKIEEIIVRNIPA